VARGLVRHAFLFLFQNPIQSLVSHSVSLMNHAKINSFILEKGIFSLRFFLQSGCMLVVGEVLS